MGIMTHPVGSWVTVSMPPDFMGPFLAMLLGLCTSVILIGISVHYTSYFNNAKHSKGPVDVSRIPSTKHGKQLSYTAHATDCMDALLNYTLRMFSKRLYMFIS